MTVHEILDKCKKLYISEKLSAEREFILEIEPNVTAVCDKYYISRTIENIIINAIQYCASGKITIKLTKTEDAAEFSVKDEGVGIPKSELRDIFGAFTTSAKTKTTAGGRGVGLALAKAAIDLHNGTISAESDGASWSEFKFMLKQK